MLDINTGSMVLGSYPRVLVDGTDISMLATIKRVVFPFLRPNKEKNVVKM